jgi:AraC-like DNA-binding protein
MRIRSLVATALSAPLVATLCAAPAKELSIRALAQKAGMNPKQFAAALSHFNYEFHSELQSPDDFLARRAGDCDDYAVAAAEVLQQCGFHTRLVIVRMVGRVAHAVCYVEESQAYLDYNNRRYFIALTSCKPGLNDIAAKVAASFEANWTSVSEFRYDMKSEARVIKSTAVKTVP